MRSSDVAACAVTAACTWIAACATPLPGGDLGASGASGDAGVSAPPVVSACLPFRSVAGVTTVSGAFRSIPQAGGGAWAIVDDAVVNGAEVPSLALAVPATASLDDCLAAATAASTGTAPVLDLPSLSPLSGVVAGGVAMLYYADPSGSIGVAAQDPVDGRFRPGATLLWTSDRPAFGTAAVTDGTNVYAIGCQGARFLDADCFVARAPVASPDDESAYGYYIGGGRWSPRVEDAWPVTSGGAALDVAWLPDRSRWLAAYVPPLGDTITLRSGLTPEGPWSAPLAVATCALADPDMFCAGIHLHPALSAPPGTIALSYAAASLSSDVASRRAAEPDKWWPQLVALPVPPLP
jgi:hypothetical protein